MTAPLLGSCARERNREIRLDERRRPSWPDHGPVTTETDHFAVGRVERVVSARVPASPYPQGVMSRFDRRLDGITVVECADATAVDRDLEPAAPELDAETFPRQPERC